MDERRTSERLYQSPLVDEREVARQERRWDRIVQALLAVIVAAVVLVVAFGGCGHRDGGPPVDNSDDPGTYIPPGSP